MQSTIYRNIQIVPSRLHTGAFIVKYDEDSHGTGLRDFDIEREIPCHNYATALWEVRNLENKSA